MSEWVCELPIDGMASFVSGTTTIPVRELVVRCRDCKQYADHEWVIATDVDHVCHFWHGEPTKVDPNGFCAWGEREDA